MATPITIGAAAGEYMESVLVTAWHVEPGARVKAGDVIAEVETAKAVTEVEAPCDGVMGAIRAEEGAEIAIDTPLGFILGEDEETITETATAPTAHAASTGKLAETAQAPPKPARSGRVVASPVARRIAREASFDLSRVAGSGPRGRIKRRDVEAALSASVGGHVETALPLMLLHGFATDKSVWSKLTAELPGTRRALRPDLPGHGAGAPAPDGGFDAFIGPVLDILDAVDDIRVHLVGHSLGGAVALALAGQRPERVASLTLIAPAGLGPQIDGEVLAGICRARQPESLLPWLRRLVADPARIDETYARAAMAGRDADRRRTQAELLQRLFPDGTQGFDLRSTLAGIQVPLRVIWGRKDGLLPWQQALTAPGNAALHLLPDVGHMPHVEAPQAVARILHETVAASESEGVEAK